MQFRFYGSVLSVLAMAIALPLPDAFDDEGEISVPRSPKIQGPALVNLTSANFTELQSLQCVIEGSPTPTVVWSKDGEEIHSSSDKYNTTYNATDGKAELYFMDSAKSDLKFITGNFTCFAANFLGRVQKMFVVRCAERNASTFNATTISANKTNAANSTENSASPSVIILETISSLANRSDTAVNNTDKTTRRTDIGSSTASHEGKKEPFTSRLSPKPAAVMIKNETFYVESKGT